MAKSKKNKKAPLRNYTPDEIIENPSNKAIIRFNNDLTMMINAGEDGSAPQGSTEYKGNMSNWSAGGGGSSITPVITFTAVNNSEGSLHFSSQPYTVVNGNVKEMPWDYEVATNTTETNDILGIGLMGDNDYVFGCSGMSGDYTGEIVASDEVNCTFDENNNWITVTDPSSNASITITYHNYQ